MSDLDQNKICSRSLQHDRGQVISLIQGCTQWQNKPNEENFILRNLGEWENDERRLVGLLVEKIFFC